MKTSISETAVAHLFGLTIFFLMGVYLCDQASVAQKSVANSTEVHDGGNDGTSFLAQGRINIGTMGITTDTDYGLSDEFGFKHDLVSLLERNAIQESARLTEEQDLSIRAKYRETITAIELKLPATTDKATDEIEMLFREMDQQLYDILTDEQRLQIWVQKTRFQIEEIGLENALKTQVAKEALGLTEAESEAFSDVENFQSQLKKMVADLNRKANQALIKELPPKQLENFNRLFGEELDAKFLDSPLFTKAKSLKDARARNWYDLIIQIRSRGNREKAGIEVEQYDRAKIIKREAKRISDAEIKSRLEEILDADQIAALRKMAIYQQCNSKGTANTLAFGLLPEAIELLPKKAENIFKIAEQIRSDLKTDIRSAQSDLLRKQLGSLSDEKFDSVIEWIGDANLQKKN